ncbi:septal ring lytic transglycosylase RlpA family protein [Rubrobacter radiotolerans]|uniref:Septal ring lytic transglycosylase RlpA family protein n=2 Tax=Rubrobacter radiotolerans TaxID=42256 RepID=A0AB35T544_RUBRA|nr:septal ring lytic transglycosylase RlpA family protein [Rubrobacter radiotolerans]MDX5894824.1 septal ring lytic transglycosylase RlpA family protein [Rubrobacter radiotolerans]
MAFLGVAALVSSAVGAQQTMNASWYGPGFEGATTASGEPFDPGAYTAAHKELPFGTQLEVCYQGCVTVVINDRGPFVAGRDLDLSQAAAAAIGLTAAGHAPVTVTYLDGSAPSGPSGGTATEPAPQQPAEAPQQPATTAPEEPGDFTVTQTQYNDPVNDQYGEAPVEDQYEDLPAETPVVDQYEDLAPVEPPVVDQYEDLPAETPVVDQYEDLSPVETPVVDQYEDLAPVEAPVVDQYEDLPAGTADVDVPEVAVPVVPDASALEAPPLELATPGSTVERRIELALAAPPAGYEGPVPSEDASAGYVHEEPAAGHVEEPAHEVHPETGTIDTVYEAAEKPSVVAGLTVLPDTGGPAVLPLSGAALLLGAGLISLKVLRSRD